MEQVNRCPDRATLLAFHLGKLDDAQIETVATHLGQCRSCTQLLEMLAPGEDAVIGPLREIDHLTPDPLEAPFQRAFAAMLNYGDVSKEPAAVDEHMPFHSNSSNVPDRLRDYRLEEKIGQGGMGTVYRAVHTRLDRLAAVKMITHRRATNPQTIARFHQEMRAVGKLDHPNLVRAYDAGEEAGVYFLAMELVPGENLSQLIRRFGRLPVADACEMIRQAALGLESAHQHGLIHRDVKPSNLMLTPTGQIKVLDLGLARIRGFADDSESTKSPQEPSPIVKRSELTRSHQMVGTPEYMAPEQKQDPLNIDHRVDIYGLGATLCRLLEGKSPLNENADRQVTQDETKSDSNTDSDSLDHRTVRKRSDVPIELHEVIRQMTASDPDQRVPTAGDVAALLQPFCDSCHLAALLEPPAGEQSLLEPARHQRTKRQLAAGASHHRTSSGRLGTWLKRLRYLVVFLAVSTLCLLIGLGLAGRGPWSAVFAPSSDGSRQTNENTGRISSSGDNLVALLDATTFKGLREVSCETKRTLFGDHLIPVDVTKTYLLSGEGRCGDDDGNQYDPNNTQYFGFASYDRAGDLIEPKHVFRFNDAVDTTLAEPLRIGDHQFTLADAAGWSNEAGKAYQRSLAWYGYTDKTGFRYADYTYTRHVKVGIWEPGNIRFDAERQVYRVRLIEPWSGPNLPAGTAVRNSTSNSFHNYACLVKKPIGNQWTKYSAMISGIELSGQNEHNRFRPGTAFIRPIVNANFHDRSGNLVTWRNVEVSLVSGTASAGQSSNE